MVGAFLTSHFSLLRRVAVPPAVHCCTVFVLMCFMIVVKQRTTEETATRGNNKTLHRIDPDGDRENVDAIKQSV